MPPISRLAEDRVDQQTREIHDLYLKEGGNVPNCSGRSRTEGRSSVP
jgi:hypothetical protein